MERVRMISSELNLNRFTVHQILTHDFGMRKVGQDGSEEPHDWAEGQSEGFVSWSSGPPWEGARILQSRYHRWWIMDFGVRPRDKMPKSVVAHCKLSPCQEKENEQIQNQIDAHLFVFFRVRGSSTRNLCHQDKLSIKLIIGKSLKYSGKGWHMCGALLRTMETTPPSQCSFPRELFWRG